MFYYNHQIRHWWLCDWIWSSRMGEDTWQSFLDISCGYCACWRRCHLHWKNCCGWTSIWVSVLYSFYCSISLGCTNTHNSAVCPTLAFVRIRIMTIVFGMFIFSISGENKHYGTPTNPATPAKVPGGSSSGAAVAVAANLVDFSLGELLIRFNSLSSFPWIISLDTYINYAEKVLLFWCSFSCPVFPK